MFNAIFFKRISSCIGPVVSKSHRAVPLPKSYPILFQAASITSKHFRDKSVKKPAPWPYKEKKFTYLHSILNLDSTLSRFDENTQLIVVEGNIGSGKTDFAKKLADELEMLYLPEPTVESLYINEYGFDLRNLDDIVPPSFKSFLLKNFYETPNHPNTFGFQINMYMLRLEQYMEALAHILNTGQGVVLERCVFSDYVFVNAMHKMGYLTAGMKSYYNECRVNSLHDMDLKPTLVIYLDCDVDTLLDRIKKRNIDYEVNSKVLKKDYLEAVDHFYKQDYLKYISKYSELHIYDWNHFGDVEEVAHDIEKIEFDKYDRYDFKLKEWRKDDPGEWDYARIQYTNDRTATFRNAMVPRYDVPEILISTDERTKMWNIIEKMADYAYGKGFNPERGDKGTLFRLKRNNYWDDQKFRLYLS